MNCKFCNSPRTMKYGFKAGTQYYKCNDCHRKFAGTLAPEGMRFNTSTIGEAMGLFYDGLSLADISRHLQVTEGIYVDPATVWRWIIRFSKQAEKILGNIKVKTSWRWVIDETVVKVGGKKLWLWDIIEARTRFLLATHLTMTRNMKSAVAVLGEANKRTIGIPSYIVSDGMMAYPDAIDRVFGGETPISLRGFRAQLKREPK
jgi:putative transposase